MAKLSERERRFIEAYMGECAGNATSAAIAAGYSAKTAASIGSRLLRKVKVRDAIARHRERISQGAVITSQRRREILSSIATDPKAHPLARIKAIDVHNKMDALYTEKHEHSGKDGGTLVVKFAGRYKEPTA